MTWRDIIKEALINLGGEAYLKEIYKEVSDNNQELPESYEAAIRDALQRNSSSSSKFTGKYDWFYSVEGVGNGKWGLREYQPDINKMDYTQDDAEFSEGRKLLKSHIQRERNHSLISMAKERFIKENGRLYCQICEFSFSEVYGELGDGFIEAHHSKAVSEMKDDEKTRIEDIVMVCSNCHSMIHRRKPWLTQQELKLILIKQK